MCGSSCHLFIGLYMKLINLQMSGSYLLEKKKKKRNVAAAEAFQINKYDGLEYLVPYNETISGFKEKKKVNISLLSIGKHVASTTLNCYVHETRNVLLQLPMCPPYTHTFISTYSVCIYIYSGTLLS